MKFMKTCSAIKLLSFYKIENSKRDNLFDFFRKHTDSVDRVSASYFDAVTSWTSNIGQAAKNGQV